MSAPAASPFRVAPYPYRALFTICSDLDETPTRAVYENIARFLNTGDTVGAMGPGVSLEIGNTIYFDMPPEQFAYWNTDEAGREMLRTLIRSGHIDAFHSFGDLATTRAGTVRSLEDLEKHGCRLAVWIDHATAPSNFGADIMKGSGDLPGSPVYHADRTLAHGVRYVWRGRVTSLIGQEVPRRFSGVFARRHPWASARTLLKDWSKGVLGRRGNTKYAMHADNALLRPIVLRDGSRVWEFIRSNPCFAAVDSGETADGFGRVVTARVLDALVAHGGSMILYTHLGKIHSHDEPLPPHMREALRLVARYQAAGRILVTTTRRILDHARARREALVNVSASPQTCSVSLFCPESLLEAGIGDPRSALSGLTVYVPPAEKYGMTLNGTEVSAFSTNPPDETGRPTLSLPWPRLRFPSLEGSARSEET